MKIKNKKSIGLLLAVALILVAGGIYGYSKVSDKNDVGTQPTSENKTKYSPPTDEEQNAGNTAKDKFDNNSEPTNNTNGVKSVTPEITYKGVYQGNVEVNSHVPGIFEKSGKCTLTLKKDGKTVSQSRTAVPNVSEMSCGLIKIPTSKLSSGTWSATITYSSVKAKGVSDEVFIGVK